MKKNWMIIAALALVCSPALALARPPQTTGAHIRPNLYHDRSPHLHLHDSVAHH